MKTKKILSIDFDAFWCSPLLPPYYGIGKELVCWDECDDQESPYTIFLVSEYLEVKEFLQTTKLPLYYSQEHQAIVTRIDTETYINNIDAHVDYYPSHQCDKLAVHNWAIMSGISPNNMRWVPLHTDHENSGRITVITLEKALSEKYDEVFVCLSSAYTPRQYYSLFSDLVNSNSGPITQIHDFHREIHPLIKIHKGEK